ncbi:uncharacterized protein LOC126969608 [Leptidea sinapis]|uniref:uncharacterized protein LOC126969608 n=1 Tax=Leptidea sinapis TaxID=189913 RepID=UPI0021C42597|nr:uncharacterized protein LOC126969608 [Leptidea sinapis]
MKLAAKHNYSVFRRQQLKTGGGEKPPSPSPEDIAIMEIAPHEFLMQYNEFDGDAMIHTTKEPIAGTSTTSSVADDMVTVINKANEESSISIAKQEIFNNEATEKNVINNNTGKSDPAIKRKKSQQNRCDDCSLIIKSNIDFKERQLEMMEEEHKINIKNLELTTIKLELEIA